MPMLHALPELPFIELSVPVQILAEAMHFVALPATAVSIARLEQIESFAFALVLFEIAYVD